LKPIAYTNLVELLTGSETPLLRDVVLGSVNPTVRRQLPGDVAALFKPARTLLHPAIHEVQNFTGRESELLKIDSALANGLAAAITQPAAVHGLGGVGKSTLAREYAWQVSSAAHYAGIWWFNAEKQTGTSTWDDIQQGLMALRKELYPSIPEPAEREPAAREMMKRLPDLGGGKPWLLIYDNADDVHITAPENWGPTPGVQILMTSRESKWPSGVQGVEVDEWPLDDAIAYLAKESARDDLSREDFTRIAEELGRLPLALHHASAYFREVDTATPASYLAALASHLSDRPDTADRKTRAVFTTLMENVRQAEARAPGATAFVTLAAFFAPNAIPEELFRQAPEIYPEPLQAVAAQPVAFEKVTSALTRLSVLTFDKPSRTFSVHRLVQVAARDALSTPSPRERGEGGGEGRQQTPMQAAAPHTRADAAPHPNPLPVKNGEREWCASAIASWNAAYPGSDFKNWGAVERLLPHGRAVANLAHDDLGEPLALLLNRAGFYLKARAAYAEAEPLYKRDLAISETALGPDHPSVGISVGNLAGLFIATGRFTDAEPLRRRELEIMEKALPDGHPHIATACNNLAELYRAQGKYDLAEPLYKRTVSIFEAALGPDHPDVGTSLNNLAELYRAQGKYDLAEPLYKRSLAIRETALGPDHPDVGASLNNLSVLLAQCGRLPEAEPLMRRANAIFQRALGDGHPNTKGTAQMLTLMEAALGKGG